MRRGSGQADGSPAAEPGISSKSATPWLIAWHGDLSAWLDRLGWLRRMSDWLTAVLGPFRERYQDNPVLELLHGGRWVGHPLHPALSDLPVGLFAGVVLLDATDLLDSTGRDPAPGPGRDAAGVLSAAGILAAGATAVTGLNDWAVSNDSDRRIGLFHGLLNTAALGLQGASLAS